MFVLKSIWDSARAMSGAAERGQKTGTVAEELLLLDLADQSFFLARYQ